MGEEEVVSLIHALDHANPEDIPAIKRALIRIGSSAADALLQAVQSGQGRKCYLAAQVLAEIGHADLENVLIQALSSSNVLLRQTSARLLGESGSHQAVGPLIERLETESLVVQLSIVKAFEKMNDSRLVDPLVRLLQATPSPTLQHAVIGVLADYNRADLVSLIRSFEDSPDHHVQSIASRTVAKLMQASSEDS